MDQELDRLLEVEQYSLPASAKGPTLIRGMNALTNSHRDRCVEYARVLGATHPVLQDATQLGDVPYLPISLFKWLELRSVPSRTVLQGPASSGTTSQMTEPHLPGRGDGQAPDTSAVEHRHPLPRAHAQADADHRSSRT